MVCQALCSCHKDLLAEKLAPAAKPYRKPCTAKLFDPKPCMDCRQICTRSLKQSHTHKGIYTYMRVCVYICMYICMYITAKTSGGGIASRCLTIHPFSSGAVYWARHIYRKPPMHWGQMQGVRVLSSENCRNHLGQMFCSWALGPRKFWGIGIQIAATDPSAGFGTGRG